MLLLTLIGCHGEPDPQPDPACTCPAPNIIKPSHYFVTVVLPGGDSLTGGDLLYNYKVLWNRDLHRWEDEPTVLYKITYSNGRVYYSVGPIEDDGATDTFTFVDLETNTPRKFLKSQVTFDFVDCDVKELEAEQQMKKDYGLQMQADYDNCPVHGSKTN